MNTGLPLFTDVGTEEKDLWKLSSSPSLPFQENNSILDPYNKRNKY